MKRFFMTCLALMIFAGSFAYAQPKLTIIGGDTHDWGKVKPKDDPLKATIKIKNEGNELLKISDVRPGCGCTTAPLDKKELNPGEIASMDVTLKLGATSGMMTKSITINSNDPQSATKVLYLKADVVRPIQILPTQYFSFGEMTVGTKSEAKLIIKNTSTQDIVLSDFESLAGITLNLTKPTTIPGGGEVELIAKVTPNDKGYFNGVVKMKTNHPDYASLDIIAYGNVKPSVVDPK
ncbi:MAG: DUF1573 domain-containing protein [Bacteroidota bacterium]|nr:DUF1573 domain-containing protein [bacterium]NBP64548.1 DUF1573 domain-containing protein [Bacteroidota bacterium]